MQAWLDFIQKQEQVLGKQASDKWLRSLKVVHFDSGNLYLEAKDSFQLLWFEEHIRPLLKSQFVNNNYRPIKVHLTVGQQVVVPSSKKEKHSSSPIILTQDKLDASCTLNNFIVGNANQVAWELFSELTGTRADTKTSLGTWNPIYICGGSGCGKTHLLMGLTHAFKKQGLNALYARAETFTEHVVSAIRCSEMRAFRTAYRQVDILLVDDVHMFAKKNATQEEFFHTFNALHTTGRQIILSSNCLPTQLEEIEPRLISRFEWGLTIHLENLRTEDLRQLIEKRCEHLHFPLGEDVIAFLVQEFTNSTSLNKALETLILRCHLEGDARLKRNSGLIDKNWAQKALEELCHLEENKRLSPDKIHASIAHVFGLKKEDILGKSQAKSCSLPRQIAMYLCRHELNFTYQKIGQIFGRDHSTVMTSIRYIEKKITEKDGELLASLAEIRTKFV